MLAAATLTGAAFLAWLAYVDVIPSLRVEARAGEAPYGSTTPPEDTSPTPAVATSTSIPEDFFLAMATPRVDVYWLERTRDSQAAFSSRFLLREPNPAQETTLLTLHALTVTHRERPSTRSHLHLELQGTYGEEDYTTFRERFRGTSGQPLPQTRPPSALNMVNITMNLDGQWLDTRWSGFNLRLNSTYRETLTEEPTDPSATPDASLLPKQLTTTFTPSYFAQVKRWRRLEFHLSTTHYHVTDQLDGLVFTPRIEWQESLSKEQRAVLMAGISYAKTLKQKRATSELEPFSPVATLTLESILVNQRDFRARGLVGAGVDWYFDPILATGMANFSSFLRVDTALGPYFSLGANLTYSTTVSRPPLTSDPEVTSLSLSVPLVYRQSEGLVFEVGSQFAMRGPYHAGISEMHRTELWAYLAITTGLPRHLPRAAPAATTPTAAAPTILATAPAASAAQPTSPGAGTRMTPAGQNPAGPEPFPTAPAIPAAPILPVEP